MVKSPIKISFEEYLVYDATTESRYELVNGELEMTPLPTAAHADRIDFLLEVFRTQIKHKNLDWKATDKAGVYIGKNPQTSQESSRTPDLCVMKQQQWEQLRNNTDKAAVLTTVPLLVVEIVSRGSVKIDYEDKKAEYTSIKVPEYWIVDGISQKVTVLSIEKDKYIEKVYTGIDGISSLIFPALKITPKQIFTV